MSQSEPRADSCATRREFLDKSGTLAFSAVAAGVGSQLAGIRQAVARSIGQSAIESDEEFEALASHYSLDPGINYLNHASIGTIPKPVQQARQQYLELCESNPWLYLWGGQWDDPREQVRANAAKLLGCDSTELVITHNTTEMFNTLAGGLPLQPGDEVLFSTLCHAGASIAFLESAKRGKYRARQFEFPIADLPGLDAEQLVTAYSEQIRPETRLLVIPHLDNTVGVRYPVRRISEMARKQGVQYIAVDAAQTAGMIPINCHEWDVDVVATSGHKWLNGPKGTGLAYVHRRLHQTLAPMWVTWGQQRWSGSARIFEDYGTRNLPEVLALGDAIDFVNQISNTDRNDRLRNLWTFARERVDDRESLAWDSPRDWDLSGSLYSIRVSKPSVPLADELFQQHGIVVRPFTTLGLNNLRVSPGLFSSKKQIERLIELIS